MYAVATQCYRKCGIKTTHMLWYQNLGIWTTILQSGTMDTNNVRHLKNRQREISYVLDCILQGDRIGTCQNMIKRKQKSCRTMNNKEKVHSVVMQLFEHQTAIQAIFAYIKIFLLRLYDSFSLYQCYLVGMGVKMYTRISSPLFFQYLLKCSWQQQL